MENNVYIPYWNITKYNLLDLADTSQVLISSQLE